MPLEPYLFFDGRCEEALEFYKGALGAEIVALLRYKESPEPEMIPPGGADKVMHSVFRIGESMVMASDGRNEGKPSFQGFALSVPARDEAHADTLFNAVGAGGQVMMPLMKTFWSPRFGMVNDRFGVCWMIGVESKG